MPQLLPFYFVNQIFYGFTALFIVIYIYSKYILPRYLQLFIIRSHLANKFE